MKKLKFVLGTLLLFSPIIVVAGALLIRYTDEAMIYDVTRRGSSVCKIHEVSMRKKIVEMTYGMQHWTPIEDARRRLFPHAEEIYDTGSCQPLQQYWARVYICTQCTKAREEWLSNYP